MSSNNGDDDGDGDNTSTTTNCSWCQENEIEVQRLTKQVEPAELVQRRINELRQDMSCCACHQKKLAPPPPPLNQMRYDNKQQVQVPPRVSDESEPHEQIVQVGSKRKSQETTTVTTSTRSNSSNTNNILQLPFKCMKQFKTCSASFKSLPELSKHLSTVHNYTKFEPTCDICQQIFDTQELKNAHKASVHGHSCTLCRTSIIFKHEASFKAHMASVHRIVLKSCQECGATFETNQALLSHLLTHEQQEQSNNTSNSTGTGTGAGGKRLFFRCQHCTTPFLTQKEMQSHSAQQHHHECEDCGSIFPSLAGLDGHYCWNANGLVSTAPDRNPWRRGRRGGNRSRGRGKKNNTTNTNSWYTSAGGGGG